MPAAVTSPLLSNAGRITGQLCVHHPQRAGHATCMACRQVVCQDCATTWDGINFCRPCLAARNAATTAHNAWMTRFHFLIQIALCAVGLAVTARMAAWSLALLRSWGT